MFNNVNQTYNFQDASQEILIMLIGAFLLGCLLTWLFNKLFNNDYNVENSAYHYDNQTDEQIDELSSPEKKSSFIHDDVKIVDKPSYERAITIDAPDDLTVISSIDANMQTELAQYGISSFTELRDINSDDLKEIQNKQKTNKREIETWPHQASLAAKGDWKKLTDYQGFIQRIQIASNQPSSTNVPATTSSQSKIQDNDELTKLKGISPSIEKVLNNKSIYSFKQLSHIDSEVLKNHLIESDSDYGDVETESWPHQAAMAEKEQWEELQIYQDFMDSDSEIESKLTKKDSIPSASLGNQENIKAEIKTIELKNPKDKKTIDLGGSSKQDPEHRTEQDPEQDPELDLKQSIEQDLEQSTEQNLSDHDDLKKIEGIGPKIEEVLNNGGIYTYSQLYNSHRDRLRKLLDEAGSQFKMHDTESWPHQAGMANRSEWKELKTYKDSVLQQSSKSKKALADKEALISGNDKDNNKNDKSATKLTVVNPKDDFKKIEGIGPKIEELLNSAGINTYDELYNTESNELRKLLDDGGSQFRMHDTESWPHQAGMANRSEWSDLKSYQKSLVKSQALQAKEDATNNAKQAEIEKDKVSIEKTSALSAVDDVDNLKKIEGIGPKIEELLNKAGINSFNQLSEHSRDEIKELLNEAGPQFRMHEPESWPHQAKLAANSEWEDLKKYQDYLIGGRE